MGSCSVDLKVLYLLYHCLPVCQALLNVFCILYHYFLIRQAFFKRQFLLRKQSTILCRHFFYSLAPFLFLVNYLSAKILRFFLFVLHRTVLSCIRKTGRCNKMERRKGTWRQAAPGPFQVRNPALTCSRLSTASFHFLAGGTVYDAAFIVPGYN